MATKKDDIKRKILFWGTFNVKNGRSGNLAMIWHDLAIWHDKDGKQKGKQPDDLRSLAKTGQKKAPCG